MLNGPKKCLFTKQANVVIYVCSLQKLFAADCLLFPNQVSDTKHAHDVLILFKHSYSVKPEVRIFPESLPELYESPRRGNLVLTASFQSKPEINRIGLPCSLVVFLSVARLSAAETSMSSAVNQTRGGEPLLGAATSSSGGPARCVASCPELFAHLISAAEIRYHTSKQKPEAGRLNCESDAAAGESYLY